jgi:subtilisin-like proprotein convertase family protein/subtilisin family serine protease
MDECKSGHHINKEGYLMEEGKTYTYRAGKKVFLKKSADEFVVRLQPEKLKDFGIGDALKVSSSSSRVSVPPVDLEPMMNDLRRFAPTHHAYYNSETGKEFLITDRIFVNFKDHLSQEELDSFAGRYGLNKIEAYDDQNYLFQVTDDTGMNPVKLVVKLNEEDPMVESADHDLNHRMKKFQLNLPKDPAYNRQWHLHTRYEHIDFDPRSSSRCEDAWMLMRSYGSPEVVVGVSDDGCKLDHPDFDSQGKFAGWGYFNGINLVSSMDKGADSKKMYVEGQDHGTSCAGVIAAEIDSALTAGAAPGCRLLPIKWESEGDTVQISDTRIRRALDFLEDKIDILSNSWGDAPDNIFAPIVVSKISNMAGSGGRRGKGVVFIWAAGNDNCPIQYSASVDIPYTDGYKIEEDKKPIWIGVKTAREFGNNLAGIPGVMHVAALSSRAQRSHYSNYGTGVDISAPSNNCHAYHRQDAIGLGITTTSGGTGNIIEDFGGTSSSAPLVAGIAALVISANPELSALETISILKQTASKDLNFEGYPRSRPIPEDMNPSWDVSPIPPFDNGGFMDKGYPEGTWSPWFGHGKVDAAKAVAEALMRRAGGDQNPEVRLEEAPGAIIPDNNPSGIERALDVKEEGQVKEVEVSVDITHGFISDLIISLTSPAGTVVYLHKHTGGAADNIIRTYTPVIVSGLETLRGQPIKGTWRLKVADAAGGGDKGRLNSWRLRILLE